MLSPTLESLPVWGHLLPLNSHYFHWYQEGVPDTDETCHKKSQIKNGKKLVVYCLQVIHSPLNHPLTTYVDPQPLPPVTSSVLTVKDNCVISLGQGEEILQTIPQWAWLSHGSRSKRQKTTTTAATKNNIALKNSHENLVQLTMNLSFNLILRSWKLSWKLFPSKCNPLNAQPKKKTEERKVKEGVRKKKSKLLCHF